MSEQSEGSSGRAEPSYEFVVEAVTPDDLNRLEARITELEAENERLRALAALAEEVLGPAGALRSTDDLSEYCICCGWSTYGSSSRPAHEPQCPKARYDALAGKPDGQA